MIPPARPYIGKEEKDAVAEILTSGMLAAGKRVKEFEEKYAQRLGIKEAVATSSGTTALQALMHALEMGPGDKVLTTPFTFIATTNAILNTGATPVFADIDPRTFNLCPEKAEEVLKKDKSIKAILLVHLYGLTCNMEEFNRLGEEYGVDILEDAAQAHGAKYKGREAGSLGRAGIFSFYPTKNMTTGEGGMVTTSDEKLAERIRLYINHGAIQRYHHEELGFNYRMTDMGGAMGLIQLERLDEFVAQRRENARFFNAHLSQLDGIEIPYIPKDCEHSFNQYTLRCKKRDELQNYLREKGIGTGVHYPKPLHQQPFYQKMDLGRGKLPQAEKAALEVLSLPVYPALSEKERECIYREIKSFV